MNVAIRRILKWTAVSVDKNMTDDSCSITFHRQERSIEKVSQVGGNENANTLPSKLRHDRDES